VKNPFLDLNHCHRGSAILLSHIFLIARVSRRAVAVAAPQRADEKSERRLWRWRRWRAVEAAAFEQGERAMPGPIVPPSLSATPKRPSLKSRDALLDNMSRSSSTCEMSPVEDGSILGKVKRVVPAKLKRKMSWGDERGEQLHIVHHVWDTHYHTRSCLQRHLQFCCFFIMALTLALVMGFLLAAGAFDG